MQDRVGGVVDGARVVGGDVLDVHREAERVVVVHTVVGEQVVDDRRGVPAVVVAVALVVVGDEEQPAAVLHEADDRGLLRRREADVRLGDHEGVEVGQVERGAGAVADGGAGREGLQAVLAGLLEGDAPGGEGAGPALLGGGVGVLGARVGLGGGDDPVRVAGGLALAVVEQDAVGERRGRGGGRGGGGERERTGGEQGGRGQRERASTEHHVPSLRRGLGCGTTEYPRVERRPPGGSGYSCLYGS